MWFLGLGTPGLQQKNLVKKPLRIPLSKLTFISGSETGLLENRTGLAAKWFLLFVRDVLRTNPRIWPGKPGSFGLKSGGSTAKFRGLPVLGTPSFEDMTLPIDRAPLYRALQQHPLPRPCGTVRLAPSPCPDQGDPCYCRASSASAPRINVSLLG